MFAVLLSAFAVPAAYQRRVLFYGVFGALAFRGLLIEVSASLGRLLPVTPDYAGQSFVRRVKGVLMATPLLVALLAIEITDLVFAMDSIPAAFGITDTVDVIFTANAFALLGLRELYFVLAGAMDRFTYVNYGLATLLVFIGGKMLLEPFLTVPILASVAVIIAVIGASIAASIWHERRAGRVAIEVRGSSGVGS